MIVHTWKMSRATAAHLHRIRQLLGILLRPRFAHPAVQPVLKTRITVLLKGPINALRHSAKDW